MNKILPDRLSMGVQYFQKLKKNNLTVWQIWIKLCLKKMYLTELAKYNSNFLINAVSLLGLSKKTTKKKKMTK